MREILSVLEDDYTLVPNRVGNLTVCDAADGTYIGYIDFNSETYESLEEDLKDE